MQACPDRDYLAIALRAARSGSAAGLVTVPRVKLVPGKNTVLTIGP